MPEPSDALCMPVIKSRHIDNRGLLMTKFITTFFRNESGAAAAEYALILAIVGSGIAAAAVALGGSISTALGNAGDAIEKTDYTPAP